MTTIYIQPFLFYFYFFEDVERESLPLKTSFIIGRTERVIDDSVSNKDSSEST